MKLRISFFSFFLTQKREDVRVMAGGGGPEWSYEAPSGATRPEEWTHHNRVVLFVYPLLPFPPTCQDVLMGEHSSRLLKRRRVWARRLHSDMMVNALSEKLRKVHFQRTALLTRHSKFKQDSDKYIHVHSYIFLS